MSSWQEYKKKHGIVVQQKDEEEAKQQEPEKQESAWERYKRVNGTPDSNQNLRKQMYERQETWNNLQARRQELENAAPTATGNRDAEWADYYRRMLNYASDTGDSKLYRDNYKQYQNAAKKVEGQYDSHAARHAEADARMENFLSRQSGYSGAKNKLEAQTRQKDRDQGFYGQMARDAERIGDQGLYNKAVQGYGDSFNRYTAAYDTARNAELEHLKKTDLARYYEETYASGRENAYSDIDHYTKDIEDAMRVGDYQRVNDRIQAMIQAPLTPEEREKATAFIDKLYETDYTNAGERAQDEVSYYVDKVLQRAEAGDLGLFLSSDEGDLAREIIQEGYGIPAELALENPERYVSELSYAGGHGERPSDAAVFAYDYFKGGKETYQTQNAKAGFRTRTDAEINRAMANPAATGPQMDSFARAYQSVLALNQIQDMIDNVDQGQGPENYTVQYLADELKQYGVNLGNLTEENMLSVVRNALAEQQEKLSAMENTLKQEGFDTKSVMDRLRLNREQRYDEDRQKSIREWAQGAGRLDKFAATLGAVGESIYLSPFEYLFGTLPKVAGMGSTRAPNEYTPENGFTPQSDLVKGEIANTLSGFGKFIYGAQTSGLESMAGGMSFGNAGYLAAMGLRSAESKTNEILQRGGSKEQALLGGAVSGLIEAASEVFTIEGLFKMKNFKGSLKQFVYGIARSMGFEASEEVTGGIADILADAFVMGNLSENSQAVQEYMNQGMTLHQARMNVWEDNALEILESAASAALSVGGPAVAFGAPGVMRSAVKESAYERAANQAAGATSTNEQQAAMRAYAEANGIEWRTAENAAQAVKQAETATQNAENAEQQEQTEQQTQEQTQEQPKTRQEKRQERREEKAQAKSEREIGVDVRRVQEHIDKQLAGKSVQEQTAIRDKLVQQYGEAIAPAVYSAVRTNAYQQAAQNANPTAIQAAKKAALEGVTDQDMRRAVSSAYDQAAVELAVKTKNTDALGRYYQQIRGTGTGNMTMEAIVKGNDGQEARSAITGMSEDGKSVTLSDGSTVAVKDLQADADTMDIIHEISALGLGKNTDKVFQAFKKSGKTGLDGYRWIMDYTTAIDQGRNRRISLQEAIKRSSLDAETVMEAYEMGHKETMDETRKAVQKNENRPKRKGVTGRVANIDTSAIQNEPMSKQEREQFDLANQIFELLGVDVKWVSSKTRNGKYVGANGSYLNGAVTLDIHAGRNDVIRDINSGILATTGHELTHFLQEYAPEQYQALKEFVLQQIVKNGKYGEATLERMIQDKQNRSSKKLTKSQAEDEVVADACQTMLRDSKALREFAEQKPGAAKEMIRWLADWFKKIKAAFSRSAQLSEQARFMEKLEKDVREAFGKLWDDALLEAVKTHDEVGNIENAAIQAQNSDRDTEYLELAKNPEKNAARLQEMVDEAARRAGYIYEVWHGTNGGDFTVFDWKRTQRADAGWYGRGHYFATHKDGASVYGKRVIHSYLRIKNPFNFQNELLDVNGQRLPVGAQSLRFMQSLGALDPEYFGKRTLEAYDNWSDQSRSIKWADIGKEITAILDGMKLRRYADGHCEWAYDYGGWSEESTKNEYPTQEAAEKAKEAAAYEILQKRLNARLPIDPAAYYLGGDMDASARFSEVLKKKGYDGVLQGTDGDEIVVFDSPQIKSADPVTYDDSDKVIPLSERFNPEQEDIRYSEREDAKPRSAQAQRGAGYKLSESKFYSLYSAHKLNMTGRGNVQEQIASIMADGFNGDGGFGNNVMPTNISYDVDENGKRIPRGLSAQKYAPKKGEYILLVPKEGIEVKGSRYNFTERVKPGYKPAFDYEIVQADYDGQPYYEMYSKAYDEAQKKNGRQYSERDYDTPSDLDLLLNAAEEISDGGGDEYWASLLENEPGLANEAEQIKTLGKQLKKTEADLAEAQRNLKLTDRKLKTRGIASLAATIMQDQKAGDINKKDVKNRITAVLTDAYQKALDQLDAGASISEAWETVYREGVVKAADILLTDATYAEKHGYGWLKTTVGKYLGEGGREYVEADIAARVAQDFDANRYRPGQKGTVADRLVAQAENRVNKKLDATKTENAALKAENLKLAEAKDFYKEQADTAKATAGELYQQLLDKREELKNNKKISADERKATLKKLDNMTRQMQAKRKEAQAWKEKAKGETKKVNQAIREKEAAVSKLEKQLQREKDILSGKLKPLAMQRLLKAVRDEAAEKATAHKEEVFQRYKERKEAAAIRNRISNLKAELQRRLTNPTDRSYVPAELATSMVDLLDSLDTSPREGTQAAAKYQTVSEGLRALAEAYNSLTTDETVGWEYKSEYDEEIRDQIKELAKTMQGRNIRDLNLEELQQVYDAVKTIRDSMRQATKLLNTNQFRDIYEAIQSIVDQQKRMTPIADVGWKERNKRRRLLEGLSVMRAVEMMSGWERDAALYSMFQGVEQGQVDADNWIMGYDKAMRPLKTGKNEKAYRDALTKQMDFGATDKESGKTVKMTKLQAIQLYMTWQREQANDKLVHLQKGGATIRDAIAIQNGKGSKAASHTVRVTPELISNIENSLTEWDRAYMKEIRGYLDKEAKAVNRVLYALKHRVLTTEAAYMPYVVDKGYLETKLEGSDVFNLFVKTPGSTQALQKKAPQPVIIDGLDNMMARHVRDQAQYIGLALPIRDFAKVFNGRLSSEDGDVYTSLKKTIEDNFEAGGTNLLVQALLDIQNSGAGEAWKSQIAAALNRLHSSFVKAALLINPSVTIKQAASYIAAESVLSQVALERGNHPIWAKTDKSKAFMPGGLIAHLFNSPEGRTAQRLYDEIDAHTSMHYIRRQGMSQAELANEAQRDGRIKRAVNAVGARMEQNKAGHVARKAGEMLNPLNWIQRMDVATTATLWVACKEQAKLDGMKAGTAEYWNRVTELYERCLRETQPMYDGLHRTAHQKQGGGLMQYLFPFRTVPIQNHGQIVAAYETMKAMKGQSKEKQAAAKKFFAKTVWAQTMSAAVFSLMTFLAAALKRKTKKYRDEDEEFTLESFLEGLGGDTASTLFSVAFPMWGSEAWSAGSRALNKIEGTSGYSYDAFTVGAVDMLNELATAGDKLFADVGKIMRGEDVSGFDVWDHVLGLMTKGAKIAGIPADTVKTYYAGIKANVQDAIEGRVPALNDETWERATAVNANRFFKAWSAGDAEKMQTVLDEVKASGKSEDSISIAFNARAKEAYEAGEISLEEYADYLGKTGMFDGEKISGKIKTILKAEFIAGSRGEDETIDALITYCGMDEDKAWETVQKWEGKAEHAEEENYNWSKYDELRAAIDANKDISGIVAELTEHGTKESDIQDEAKKYLKKLFVEGKISEDKYKNQLSRYCGIRGEDANKAVNEAKCKKVTGYAPDDLDDAYRGGEISKTDVKNALTRYGGLTGTDADKKIRWWDQQKAHPDLEITEGACNSWYDGSTKTRENGHESAKAAGMSLESYLNAKAKLDKISDANDNGTGEDEYIAALAKMNLTPRQKDALYYEKYKGGSRKGIYKTW